MRWLSESFEALAAQAGDGAIQAALVVGSGYGGAVAALRLAEAGEAPLVLERGEERLPGEFPNDAGELPAHVRLARWGEARVTGYESGLFDFRLGNQVGALVGNALGGGSQINAGVAIAPDVRVFAKPGWPRALGEEAAVGGLDAWFERARRALGVEDFGAALERASGHPPGSRRRPAKNRALEALGDALRDLAPQARFEHARIAVRLEPGPDDAPVALKPCVACGDCVTGCNHGAKKTLTVTYLPRARQAGARLFTGVTVRSIERGDGVWIVHAVRTAMRAWQRDGVAEVGALTLRARRVVLAAGTFGSTEILLRSRRDHALALSARLGHGVSTNGDSIAVGYRLSGRVEGVGAGALPEGEASFFVGPSISGQIRIDDLANVERSVLIQEGAIPGALAGVFHEMVTTAATFAQLGQARFAGEGDAQAPDHLALDARALTHSQTLLAMGHDSAGGVLALKGPAGDSPALDYPGIGDEPVFQRQEALLARVRAQGGLYLANPALRPVPQDVGDVLSGPRLGGGAFTVHPLGGCAMGDDARLGVVDDCGRVYDPVAGAGAVHDGLMVLDGAIMPGALGVNPLLTITMLAERAMARVLPADAGRAGRGALVPLPARPAAIAQPSVNPQADRIPLLLTEVMRDIAPAGARGGARASLLLRFPVADIKRLFAGDGHRIALDAAAVAAAGAEGLGAQLRLDPGAGAAPRVFRVTGGGIALLAPPRPGRRARLLAKLRALLTWLIERGWDEIVRKLVARVRALLARWRGAPTVDACPAPAEPAVPLGRAIAGVLRMAGHAAEERRIDYDLNLVAADGAEHRLLAVKRLGYAATWPALWRHLARRALALAARLFGQRLPYVPLERRNVWRALGEVDYRLVDARGGLVAQGRMCLDLVDMGHRFMPQLGNKGDTTNAMIAAAGFFLMFGRLLVKTRLWDFRLPDYPRRLPPEFAARLACVPAVGSTDEVAFDDIAFPPLRTRAGAPVAGTIHTLTVARFRGGRERADDPKQRAQSAAPPEVPGGAPETIDLKLIRYARPDGAPPGHARVGGATRVKSILLFNGFAQSTLPFVAQELERDFDEPARDEPNLAEFFHAQGFDVWLFDYRTSTLLPASKLPCSMDDIAALDVPAAVDHVIAQVSRELALGEADFPQIHVYAHCVGAASVAMSLLAGHLRHRDGPSKVAAVALSQMQMFLVAGRSGLARLNVPPLLRDLLRVDTLRLSAAERAPDAFEAVLDRLFGSLEPEGGECCPDEHARVAERPDITTCKRMAGTLAPLLKHDRIRRATHERLPIYFGRANVNLLAHGGKCVEYERLVNEDGQNVYVTEANIAAHLDIPVALVHGRRNLLFDVESCTRTFDELSRVNPRMRALGAYRAIVADDFAHFDTTLGYGAVPDTRMQEQILAPLKDFFAAAWHLDTRGATRPVGGRVGPRRSRLRAPLAGPIIGWARDGLPGKRVVRVWIEIDETETEPASHLLTCVRGADGACELRLWPVLRVPAAGLPEEEGGAGPDARDIDALIAAAGTDRASAAGEARVAIGLADLEFDRDDPRYAGGARVRIASVHEVPVQPGQEGEGGAFEELAVAAPLDPADLAWFGAPAAALREVLVRAPRTEKLVSLPVERSPEGRPQEQVLPLPLAIDAHPGLVARWFATLECERALHAEVALAPVPATYSLSLRALAAADRCEAFIDPRTLGGANDADAPLRFFAACCRYPGLAFEAGRADASLFRMAERARQACPDFSLFVGDQIYADATAALVDATSPVEKVALRYRKAFSTPGFRAVAGRAPAYMVLDDHEIDDNWSCDRNARAPEADAATGRRERAAQRLYETACAAYAAYQWSHGPRRQPLTRRGVPAPGFNTTFESGGFAFFVLDTRTQRRRFGAGAPRVVAPGQLEALIDWLRSPMQGRPRFIVSGSVCFPGLARARTGAGDDPVADTWQMASHQREAVLAALVDHPGANAVFLSGDYHLDAIAELRWGGARQALAIAAPPLYAPFPGANVKPWEVLAQEEIVLPGGRRVEVRARCGFGSGFVELSVAPAEEGRWRLTARTVRLDFNAPVARPDFEDSEVSYVFGASGVITSSSD